MNIKRCITALCAATVVVCALISGCDDPVIDDPNNPGTSVDGGSNGGGESVDVGISFTRTDMNSSWTEADSVLIQLADGATTVSGQGATVDGDIVTITQEGTYVLSGQLSDGRIEVRADKLYKVHIVLNGVDVSNSTTAPFYVWSADKVVVTLAAGTVNTFTDSESYVDDQSAEGAPNACIYSRDDISFNGTGTLNVNANFNNGIGCSNDVKIISGVYNINAVNNGIKGKDSVSVKDGTVNIDAEDGIKSDNELEEDRGVIYITGGEISIRADDDALQATNYIVVTGGNVETDVAGKKLNCGGVVSISGGSVN